VAARIAAKLVKDVDINVGIFCVQKFIFALFLLAFAAYGQQDRVAIINTMDNLDSIHFTDLAYLTNKLRETAVNVLPKAKYGVMTTESIIAFLGSQENAIKVCKEASCLAELGRKVSADYVAQARIGRFSGELAINCELYSSKSGNLLGSFAGSSKDLSGLLAIINENAPILFKKLPGASGSSSPFVAKGISGVKSSADYELSGGKRYLVNLSTEPQGAILSFDGVPSAGCPKTPCKVELGEGSVRIIAALEQYEVVDTTVSIVNNNQSIAIRLKSSFGILEIKPAYIDGIGEYDDWNLAINDRVYDSFENKFSPGNYNVKLSHKCYETVSFMAGINKGSREVFDMAGNIKLKKGGLDLSAERDGEPVVEPVFVNGKQVGDTPFSDAVPLCADIEIGEDRETVDVALKHNEKVMYKHKIEQVKNEKKDKTKETDRRSFSYGVRTGFNMSQLQFNTNDTIMNISIGMQLGFVLDIAVRNRLHIQPSLMYIQKGAGKTTAHYLEFIPLMSLKFGWYRINVGPYGDVLVVGDNDLFLDIDYGISLGHGLDIGRFYVGMFLEIGLGNDTSFSNFTGGLNLGYNF